MSHHFPLTREAALARWREFLPVVPEYGARRNFVVPGHTNVSRLSPAIRLGLLSPEEIARETLAAHGFQRAEKWLQEVCWRSYWKGWLEMRPQVWTSWRERVRMLRESLPAEALDRLLEVSEGRSGVAVMDHFANELRATGYLHNHARMWWASFWIHAEGLPWELGAEFFFQHLLDADPASNTLSWRWVAGLQTAGKTYLVRRSNLERYCAAGLLADTRGLERLEDGRVVACPPADPIDLTWQSLPELPTNLPPLQGRVGLWLHPDDLCVEISPLAGQAPVSIAAFTCDVEDARHGLSELRIAAARTAICDGLARASHHFRVAAAMVDTLSLSEGISAWMETEKLDAIIALCPTIGPVADALPEIRSTLSERNVALHLLRRPWDARLFPSAGKGFFPFWERTARWLKQQFPRAQMTFL